MRFLETFNDLVWLSYARPLRTFREMKDLKDRIAYFARLSAMGVEGLDYAVMVDRMNPLDAMRIRIDGGVTQPGIVASVDPKDYPMASDLIVVAQPFDYPNRQGDPTGKERNAIGTTFRPLLADLGTDIGARFEANHVYRKLASMGEGGMDPEFTSDWSEDGMDNVQWVRTA
jgi:hypothetical protein